MWTDYYPIRITTNVNMNLDRITDIPQLPPRQPDSHKGDYGRVLVMGGSRGLLGAPSLTANAALRAGAGLVTVAAPESVQPHIATLCPCATTIPLPETRNGVMYPAQALTRIFHTGIFNENRLPDVIAAGPGLSRGPTGFDESWVALLQSLIHEHNIPCVIDADGLNALPEFDLDRDSAGEDEHQWPRCILTPHPGEMARLCQTDIATVQQQREKLASKLARRLDPDGNSIVVLKGHQTIVTDGQRLFVNDTGNPGMATGGSGDVLTGIIAALVGQDMSLFDAAVAGVHAHGRAGDAAASARSPISLMASDIIDHLHEVL